jgi:hypothetical protein
MMMAFVSPGVSGSAPRCPPGERLEWLYLGWTHWLGSGVAPQPERALTRTTSRDRQGVVAPAHAHSTP